ncbi:MAG: putative RNA-binding protein YlxR (DUF448 family) [Vicingaceae bacterium]|jgi:predicted RNA-binding protein YlxR (DUF448 family)
MPLNLIKIYPQLLEILHFDEHQRKASLRRIFDRDVTNNENFQFLSKVIRPTKIEGEVDLGRVFHHLTTEDEECTNEDGKKYIQRRFEKDRSQRLHWLKVHIDSGIPEVLEVFSVVERDQRKRKDVIRTYILNQSEKYVVVLEPQRSGRDYYLLTAYYLNKKYGLKQLKKKMKKKLDEVL